MNNQLVMSCINVSKDEYYKLNGLKPIDVKVILTENVYNTRLEMAINNIDKDAVEKNKSFIQNLNGTLVFGEKVNDVHSIIISIDQIDENFSFISTFIHELTHIHDFINYAYSRNCVMTQDIENCNDFMGFYYWTEFHAKREGYKFYRNLLISASDLYNDIQAQFDYIRYKELSFHIEWLIESLGGYVNNPIQYMYTIIQFLGRYSVWNDLFPDEFSVLPTELTNTYNNQIVQLYDFLYENPEFDNMNNRFNKLHEFIMTFL